jgi:ABC-type phosphate transport system auxiliary subunit
MEADHKRTLRESVSIAEEEVRKANAVANAKVRTVSTAFEQLAEAARGLQKAEAQQRREAQTASAAAAKTRAELEGLKTELISLRDTQVSTQLQKELA